MRKKLIQCGDLKQTKPNYLETCCSIDEKCSITQIRCYAPILECQVPGQLIHAHYYPSGDSQDVPWFGRQGLWQGQEKISSLGTTVHP